MATLEGLNRDRPRRRNLRLVTEVPEPTVRDVFAPFASTHPSMPRLLELDVEQLYGGILEPTDTTRLRAVVGSLYFTFPPARDIPVAQSVLDFGQFKNKTTKIGDEEINFKAYIRDLSIPHEFLADHASEPRYCAVSKAILAVIDLDTSRDPQKESVLGPGTLLKLGHLALFAVDQEEYTAGYRAIIRSRAST